MTTKEMKQANESAGFKWFTPGAMKFFGTKLHGDPKHLFDNVWCFVTSEQPPHGSRGYTLRTFVEGSGEVASLFGTVCVFDSLKEAQNCLGRLQCVENLSWEKLYRVSAFVRDTQNLGLGLSPEQKTALNNLVASLRS